VIFSKIYHAYQIIQIFNVEIFQEMFPSTLKLKLLKLFKMLIVDFDSIFIPFIAEIRNSVLGISSTAAHFGSFFAPYIGKYLKILTLFCDIFLIKLHFV
jgi:hypothetical protein